jgi:hypothetical protein
MAKVKDMTIEDLEHFIEQKLLDIFGDPDTDLHLKDDFRKKLEQRLGKPSKRFSHEEVLKKFG